MSDTISLEMHCDNYIIALGEVWSRHGCIPMGGSFSAQAADLHSVWGVYTNRTLLRQLGSLKVSEGRWAYWESSAGIVSLCQFRDNILIASTFPDTPATPIVQQVCDVLSACWNLHVLCDCM